MTPTRIAALGGLLFAGVVVVQNILRSAMPANDAPIGDIIAYYETSASLAVVFSGTYVLSALGIAAFAGGILDRMRVPRSRPFVFAGVFGIAGIFALFSTLLAVDLAVGGIVAAQGDPATVLGMWTLHNSVFAILTMAIGIATAALSVAGVGNGLLPKVWLVLGPLGGLLLAINTALAPLVIAGSPLMFIGLAGFAVWVLFVVWVSIGMLRRPAGA